MSKSKRLKKKISNFLFDHPILHGGLNYAASLLLCIFSAFIFGFGFCSFITPGTNGGEVGLTIITGGVSGISQVINLIFRMCGVTLEGNIIQSISYFVINIPLLFFAFKFIGRRFAILTIVNVAFTSLFMSILQPLDIVQAIAGHELIREHVIARVLFGGVCTGLSSGLAFKGLFSAGGMDIVAYAISLRKSANTGRYSIILNIFIIATYTLLNIINAFNNNDADWIRFFIGALFAAVYLVVVSLVIDLINVRNKKYKLTITTEKEHLSDVIIANCPHGLTLVYGKGGYSHKDKIIVSIVVPAQEIKHVLKVVRTYDSNAFIEVSHLEQVFGNFYIKPVE